MRQIFLFSLFLSTITLLEAKRQRKCRDTDPNCAVWVATNFNQCNDTQLIVDHCFRSCETCGDPIDRRYNLRNLPSQLTPIAWLVGRWRSEFGGKAFFPTIPKFTYGEELDFSISDDATGRPSLNYTAFAWDINMPDGDPTEIHSENGYLAIIDSNEGKDPRKTKDDAAEPENIALLTTAMSNGFMTVEEGDILTNQLKFRLHRIGRISFSHDSAVRLMFREWTLLDEDHLEARLLMTTTVTRRLMEHTSIIYERIYP